jgi:hypothetical protein
MQNQTTMQDESYLVNFKNYYVYADMIAKRDPYMTIYVPKDITAENIVDHINGIDAILKDGIDEEYVHNLKIEVSWGNGVSCKLFIVDYWYNLFMWSMILKNGNEIKPKHIFWEPELKKKNIKNFVDEYVLTKENKIKYGNVFLNNNICDGLWYYSYIEQFSYYLANTINNEDDIDLMNAVPEFRDLIHVSLSGVPFDQVKDAGMEATNRAIDIIKNSKKYIGYDHGLANSFRASEAINPRQYKEARLNIGTKPNGSGGIFPYIIDKSFTTGGVNDPLSYFIESSCARFAQIMSKTNVGDSGDFARLLGLNNMDTILNLDKNYECMSQHFMKYTVKSDKHLSMIKNRYYRMNPRGMQYLVDYKKDKQLIGKTVYLRSPMTCASKSSGTGICKCCYGDLYWTNLNINVGKIAAEILSSILTQILLSAKHLLESRIVSVKWLPQFQDFFDVDINAIKLTDLDGYDLKKYHMIIDPDDVFLVNEEEDTISYDDDGNEISVESDNGSYNEYITRFHIKTPSGDLIECGTQDNESMYISKELNEHIRRKAAAVDGKVSIPLDALNDDILFYIKISNDEISKTMNDIINIINKSSVTETMTKDEALQNLVDLVIDGGLNVDSVHLEVILSNQIVDPNDVLKRPNWNDPYAQYKLFTLDHSLVNNPSIIVSLLYKDLHKVLYNPLSFSKNAPSFFDLFFCEQPQVYMSSGLYTEETPIKEPDKGIEMVKMVKKGDVK